MNAATLFVRHQVENYGAWRTVYDSIEDVRLSYGCTGAEVLTGPGDKNDIFVIHRFPTVGAAQAFASSEDLKAAMARAGVASAPRIEIATEA